LGTAEASTHIVGNILVYFLEEVSCCLYILLHCKFWYLCVWGAGVDGGGGDVVLCMGDDVGLLCVF